MELKIFIRQNPVYNSNNLQIYYDGTTPYNLQATVGTLPLARQWPGYGVKGGWTDVTEYVSDLHKLKITWTIQRDNEGVVIPGANDIQKSVTGSLSFEGTAHALIRSWLTEDVSSPLNSVQVKILDTACGEYYEGYTIRPEELQWCDTGLCVYDVVLKQQDELLNCIKRTFIFDNWQGWFPTDGKPLNGKKHPRFAYCKEQRPNGILVMLWYMMAQVMAPVASLLALLIITVILPTVLTINAIISVVNGLGGNISFLPVPNPQVIIDSFSIYFIEAAGCGREHPAPLIRDYISNVCDKCGITVDASTAPIFFSPKMDFETSSRGTVQDDNPYYNACYFFPQTRRGIRRYESVNIFGSSPLNTDEYWIDDNRPLLYLDMFLDQIKTVFNAEWRVKQGKLYFQRKDYYLNANPVYDFTLGSPDRLKIVEGVCYDPVERKYPASAKGLWVTDATDMNESGGTNGTGQMNGIVEFGSTDNNPNFYGIMDKTVQFGATKFRYDGASRDYLADALQQVANAGIIGPNPLISYFQVATLASYLHDLDYCLLLQSEVVALPKILCWNGLDYLNARCVTPKSAGGNNAPYPIPDNNPVYYDAAKGLEPWYIRHEPITKVLGDALSVGSAPFGVYEVQSQFGTVFSSANALLVNYPMYFEPYYYDTMWDRFHWIDDPQRNPTMNFNWRVKIRLCCEDLDKLGLFQYGENIALGQRVKLPFGYYQDGVLREITVSYDPTDTYGMYIELSGTL